MHWLGLSGLWGTHMVEPNRNILKIGPSGTVKLSEMVRGMKQKGEDVISFAVGEPDFDTPPNIVDAAVRALQQGETHYTSSYGIWPLRVAIAEKCQEDNDIPCMPMDVIATPTKFGIYASIASFVGSNDEVLLANPAWVSYDPVIKFCGGKTKWVPAGDEEEYQMTPENVNELVTSKSKMIIINTPSNPTGAVMKEEYIRGIAEIAKDNDLVVLADEIYEKILYEGKHLSIASLPEMYERTITVNGFSKAYAMTGWRSGYIVAPRGMLRQIIKLQQHIQTCTTTFAQYGSVEAIQGPQDCLKEMVAEFKARRNLVVEGLNKIDGISCPEPHGAFYTFFKYDHEVSSMDLAIQILQEAKIGFTPGSTFGSLGENHMRFSYATSREKIKEGLSRLEDFISNF